MKGLVIKEEKKSLTKKSKCRGGAGGGGQCCSGMAGLAIGRGALIFLLSGTGISAS